MLVKTGLQWYHLYISIVLVSILASELVSINIYQVGIFKPLYISDLFTGSLPSVKVVLEIAGNSVMEDRDDHNRTALVLATMGGHGEIVNFLLSEGGEYSDFYRPQRSCSKVMFSQASVILFTGGGVRVAGGGVCGGGVHGRRACVAEGCAWQGACMAGGGALQRTVRILLECILVG